MAANTVKILAIDDNRDNLTSLKAVVQDVLPGCEVLTASNGTDGIQLARTEDPDVILLDIVMPRMDWFDVCRQLKADALLRSIPVVFLTSLRSDRESRVKALELGAEAFLAKPLDEQELVAQVLAMTKLKAATQLRRSEKEELSALVAERTQELEQELAERKQIEEALRQSEKHYRLLVQNLHAGLVVHGPETEILFANDQAAKLLGLSTDQVPGKTARDPTWQFLHEDGTPMPLEDYPVERVLATRQPIRDMVMGIDRPGTSDCVWILVNAFPEFDAQQRLQQIVVTFVDISDRVRVETELAKHREHLEELVQERTAEVVKLSAEQRTILDSVPARILYKDTENRFLRVNRAAADSVGFSIENMEGKTACELFPNEAARFYTDDLEVINSGQPKLGIVESITTSSRKRLWILTDKIPHRDETGNITGVIVFSLDITKRKQAEDEAAKRNHELRIMVNAMAGRENRMAELKREVAALQEQLAGYRNRSEVQ